MKMCCEGFARFPRRSGTEFTSGPRVQIPLDGLYRTNLWYDEDVL